MSYKVDYDKVSGDESVKRAKALEDCVFWLGGKRQYNKIIKIVREDANTLEGRIMLLSFAGIQGYPARIMAEEAGK